MTGKTIEEWESNNKIMEKMKKPTELEVELSKLLSEAIEGLFDAGQDSMAKHIVSDMAEAIKKSKQTKTQQLEIK